MHNITGGEGVTQVFFYIYDLQSTSEVILEHDEPTEAHAKKFFLKEPLS